MHDETTPPTEIYEFPASHAQQRLWFLDQLMPGNSFYNIHAAVPLDFPVDSTLLQATIDGLVDRHESLRTTIDEHDDEVWQRVSASAKILIEVTDISTMSVAHQPAEIERLSTQDASTSFDLAVGPLLRVRLVTLEPSRHLLLVTIHHVIADAWSMGVFFRELGAMYEALATGRPHRLPDLAIQYADFAVWQREQLSGERLERQLSFWRQALPDCPPIELPTDRPRPVDPTFATGTHAIDLPQAVIRRVEAVSRDERATAFMVLLAAFGVLMQRYARQDTVVVGVPVAGRNRTELEPLIGFFINTLVFPVDVSGQPTFREVVSRVRDHAIGAFANQDVPFERLVDELHPDRDLGRNPLYQVTFQLHNQPGTSPTSSTPPPSAGRRNAANFDLGVDLWPTSTGLELSMHYSSDLFDASTIVRMTGHFGNLLTALVNDPDAPVSAHAMQSDDELDMTVAQWNDTGTDYPRDACLAELFAEQAALRPDSVALVLGDDTVTYRELDDRSDRVAAVLRAHGVGKGDAVAMLLDRSIELIESMVGIVKAGGAYIGMSPDDPPSRLAAMVSTATCPVVVTCESTRTIANAVAGDAQVIVVDRSHPVAAPQVGAHPAPATNGDDLAYVSFTSGSTGEPKGVSITHRSVIRLVRNTNYHQFRADEVYLSLSPIAFDASTFEIWGCLLNGAQLVIAPPGALSLAEIGRQISGHAVTTLWLTAGLFHQMVDEELAHLAGVQTMLTGGDVVSATHCRTFLELPGDRRLINGYGPTENTTFACCHIMDASNPPDTSVPIGRPISNSRVYVLDDERRPVPIGVPGELWLAGDGLARGYLGDIETTHVAFVDGPFDHVPEDRMYRTGDLVRLAPDATLWFLGRLDRQLKLRGFRIEPAEVEAAICSVATVRDAVLTTTNGPGGDVRLEAFVVTSDDAQVTVDGIRRHLQQRLPTHMVPNAIHLVDRIPLTANGKVDRERLTIEVPGTSGVADCRPPSTDFELALLPIWQEVLGSEQIGATDNFFSDLGGHSLLGTQVIARIREAFDIDLPLRTLFESPDLEGLALAVEEAMLDQIEALDGASELTAAALGGAPL